MLQDCPHMTAKCPHKTSNCAADGADCHYVLQSRTSSSVAATMLLSFTNLSAIQKLHLQRMARLLEPAQEAESTLRDQILAALVERTAISPKLHGITIKAGQRLDFIATNRSGTKAVGIHAFSSQEDLSSFDLRELIASDENLVLLILALPAGRSIDAKVLETSDLPALESFTDANEIAARLLDLLAEGMPAPKPLKLREGKGVR